MEKSQGGSPLRGGTNMRGVGAYNERIVLELLREHAPASRAWLSKQAGLNAQTISNIVSRLLDKGLLKEAGKEEDSTRRGKPGMMLEVNPDGRYAIGVQIDRAETALVIMDLLGKVREQENIPTSQGGPLKVTKDIVASVERLVGKAELNPEKILGIGVAYPGPVDYVQGLVYGATHLRGWPKKAFPLKAKLEEFLPNYKDKVTVENDATAAAIGEHWAGVAQGYDNFAFIYMGAGLGAGLFIHGRAYRGATTSAGEFGHMTLHPKEENGEKKDAEKEDGRSEDPLNCWCGNYGCVETYSAPEKVEAAVTAKLQQGEASILASTDGAGANGVTFKEICQAAVNRDPLALSVLCSSTTMLGHGVANLVNLLDVKLVVLGGWAFWEAAHIYQEEIDRLVKGTSILRGGKEVEVKISALFANRENPPGAMGAASLVLHTEYAPRIKPSQEFVDASLQKSLR